MFDKLSQRLTGALESLRGRGRITEENIGGALRQVRMALLEADVALPVVKTFIEAVKTRALGAEVSRSLTPGQAFIKIVHDELVSVMGGEQPSAGLNLRAAPPLVVLLAGLQGAGKTTTAAKLARWAMGQGKKRVLLASADVHRPAAILQLEKLAEQVGASFCKPAATTADAIAAAALEQANKGLFDIFILDTAGRLHVDAGMMDEIKRVDRTLQPRERLFVVDSMAGQDAVNAARAFSEALELTGVILTKADGDARGGAALSVRQITGKPIIFMGTGEKIAALEPFHPDRIASRILGMGDVVSLVEEVQQQVDEEQAEKLARKLTKGQGFDFIDLREQLTQVQRMGGVNAMLEKLPSQLKGKAMPGQFDERQIKRQIAAIDSMTPRERRRPHLIDGSRKRRIANGSGLQVQDINRLLKQHLQMQKAMKKLSKGGLHRLMRGMGGGRLPWSG